MSYLEELFELKDKIVVLTGCEGILGREYNRALSAAGAKVVGFDIKGKKEFRVDITKKKEVTKAVHDVYKKYGKIDVLINNAAMNPIPGSKNSKNQFSPYEKYPEELWQKELSVGLTGALFCIQAVVPFMKKQQSGSIINISSTYGNVGPDNRIYEEGKYKSIGYATTKGAILNFTRAWATYLVGTGIRVNTMTLGGVSAGQKNKFVENYSRRTVLGRMAERDEYNGAIIFLASDASSYMTGSNLIIDGGWTAF